MPSLDDLIKAEFAGPEKTEGDGLNAVERAALSYGTGAWEGIRKAANWSFGMPSAPDVIQDKAVREGAERLKKITQGHALSGELPAFIGELIGPTVLTAPLGPGVAAASRLSALKGGAGMVTRALTRAGSGAAQGAVAGGMMGDEEGTGAGVGAATGVLGPAVFNYLARGGQRASESAVRLVAEGKSAMAEVIDKYMKKGMTHEEAIREAGSQLRKVTAANGERLTGIGTSAGRRVNILGEYGDEAGEKINEVMRAADARGLTGSPDDVYAKLVAARDEVVRPGPGGRLTDTDIAARQKIDEHIARFMREFQAEVVPGEKVMATELPTTRPLTMHPDEARRLSPAEGGAPIIAESRVGASAPDTLRVFDPPENPIRRVARDAKGRATKGWVATDQPGLQTSREVDVPTEAWEPWRTFRQRQGWPRTEPGTGRPRPMARNQYSPREVTDLGGEREVGQYFSFQDLPLSEFEEGGKRAYQRAAYLAKGSGAYRTDQAAQADPFNQWLRKASGVLKGNTEDKLPADLLTKFMPAKERSQLASTFKDLASDVATGNFSHDPVTGGSLHGTLYRLLVRDPMQAARPYLIAGNEGLEKLAGKLPEGTQEAIMNAVIEMLRQKESR